MPTSISAESIFNRHATALGLPTIGDGESFADYIGAHGKTDEGARCLQLAVDAAAVAAHDEVHTWLAQARQQIKNPFPPDRR